MSCIRCEEISAQYEEAIAKIHEDTTSKMSDLQYQFKKFENLEIALMKIHNGEGSGEELFKALEPFAKGLSLKVCNALDSYLHEDTYQKVEDTAYRWKRRYEEAMQSLEALEAQR